MLKVMKEIWHDASNYGCPGPIVIGSADGHVFININEDEDNTDEEPTEGQCLISSTEAQMRVLDQRVIDDEETKKFFKTVYYPTMSVIIFLTFLWILLFL